MKKWTFKPWYKELGKKIKAGYTNIKKLNKVNFILTITKFSFLRTMALIAVGISFQMMLKYDAWYMWLLFIAINWSALTTLDIAYKSKCKGDK
ncbi:MULTISPECIES: hypothetical protein [Bacillus cereus group]|uniref:hypothetical protein n=1 Tax=Bacillus cereus group sp. BfR-BA-01494 TaxID=2920362 RepID=UPI001F598611|nr:hypothetical protein [Bacillus cereus]MED3356788.1 hypothetical protein [Bacillus thuringiensis]